MLVDSPTLAGFAEHLVAAAARESIAEFGTEVRALVRLLTVADAAGGTDDGTALLERHPSA